MSENKNNRSIRLRTTGKVQKQEEKPNATNLGFRILAKEYSIPAMFYLDDTQDIS